MTDKPERPRLGLHERTTIIRQPIHVDVLPGTAKCPACRGVIRLDVSTTGRPTSGAQCPHCNVPLALEKDTPTK